LRDWSSALSGLLATERASPKRLFGDDGADTLDAAGTVDGGPGDDVLRAQQPGANMVGGPGSDQMLGGPGRDTASYGGHTQPVVANLDGLANDGAEGEDDLIGVDVENLFGGAADDELYGDERGNMLGGGGGNDHLIAGAGHDSLSGGPGVDWLEGGDGWDDLYAAGVPDERVYFERLDGGAGNDRLLGGPGGDVLIGGPGQDLISGGGGPDRALARDNERDRIACGGGTGSSAEVDTGEIARCETVTYSASPFVVVEDFSEWGVRCDYAHIGRCRYSAELTCPVGAKVACRGLAVVRVGRIRIGHAHFALEPSRSVEFTRAPNAKAKRRVGRRRTSALRLSVETRDDAGRSRTLIHRLGAGIIAAGTLAASDLKIPPLDRYW
jgi:Ca2+-binding RTX toxin-like protein